MSEQTPPVGTTINSFFVRRRDPARPGHYFPAIGGCQPEDYVDLPWDIKQTLNDDDLMYVARMLAIVEAKKNGGNALG